ncbi:unnamed protein product [Durusdinium trenchii]|uniref:Uncharacterized protein n=2 Tax=Durusdinium trenchii TaxID=1381693 RepID=A0ABP0JXI3_9DINO
MGRIRWKRAGEQNREPALRKRGRPDKKNNPQLIEMVEQALSAASQPSSRLSWDPQDQEWKIVSTLMQDKKSIWQQGSEIRASLGLSTFWRLAKKHLRHFKEADSINDYCIYCYDLKKKVLPQVKDLLATVHSELTAIMPNYFAKWDAFEGHDSLLEKPGLHLRQLRHFVEHHSAQEACRRHRHTSWPCGLGCLRNRRSGFPQRNRVTLFAKEADMCVQLEAMSKLLDSYLFHRSANEFQKPVLTNLLVEPPAGTVVVLSDFKELFTLPVRSTQTGEEFFANARMEISIFGSVVSERRRDGTVEWTRVLILSDILDHTSCRASQCIDQALRQRRGTNPVDTIHLLSDAGPHFRSYEALHHYCCVLPVQHQARVCVHYGVEKHFKSEADRLFAIFERNVKDARKQGTDLVEIADLCKFLADKNQAARSADATAPLLVIINDVGSQKKPANERYRLQANKFHITRTYCLSSAPVAQGPSRLGVKVFNHVFSNMVAATNLTSDLELLPSKDSAPAYRRGFWSETGRERWDHDVRPLGLHEETTLTRRQSDQSHLLPDGANLRFTGVPDAHCLIEKRKQRAEKQTQRAVAQKKAAMNPGSESSDSSSGSDSSSSSTSSSQN